MWRERLWLILEGTDPQYGRRYAIFSTVVILVGAVAFALSTLPDLAPRPLALVHGIDAVVIAIFTAEYALRLVSARRPLRYAASFWGIVDLLAFLPAIVVSGLNLQATRLLRLILLARILKLMRLHHAFDVLADVLADVWQQLVVFLIVILVLLFLSATGIYYFERHAQPEAFASVPHAMWWAIVTYTTVGYGDVVPVTTGGKIFTGIILLIGLAVVAVPTGLISASLVSKTAADRRGRHR